ncbi:hypothetical protein CEUSTIGMA_g3632.t1 [Chlamydomonas eustigma]|uniref:Uncharacterized protein n=1 Tax=Chlamydomonas eustigma TaxID=1157962 RepID=A0A250WZC2_9CHLO|nr:hypothetical protein CEUSTIGMA_g3632.t1 [Chlamydomonas eustigma]|eukprot:GAX76188.1 hypothetical protein CEUSTIGMA_g3632.t1 [Chlamydomonas eustigma]
MDCTRIGPQSICFCTHKHSDHVFVSKKAGYPRCQNCPCQHFEFIPQRPEEVGDWWLPRRKGFNVHTWRAKCRCGHGHDEHDTTSKRCKCGCGMFESNFACVVCDLKWEDHETVFETTQERLASGRTVGEAFRPLANDSEIQQMVFPTGGSNRGGKLLPNSNAATSRVRPVQVASQYAEKSVQIMHESSGGVIKGQSAANRWGKVENPPEEWLYQGPGTGLGPSKVLHGVPSSLRQQISLQPKLPSAPQNSQKASATVHSGMPTVSSEMLATAASKTVRSSVVPKVGSRPVEGPKQLQSGFRPVYD